MILKVTRVENQELFTRVKLRVTKDVALTIANTTLPNFIIIGITIIGIGCALYQHCRPVVYLSPKFRKRPAKSLKFTYYRKLMNTADVFRLYKHLFFSKLYQ